MGEGDSFTEASARMSGPAASANGDLGQSDIWIEGDAVKLLKQSGQDVPPMFDGVRTFALGLTLGDSPVVDLVVGAKDDASAGLMLGMLQGLTPFLATSPAAASAAKAVSFKQEGSSVRMHMVVPPELVTMIQQQAASAASDAGNGGGFPAQLAPLLGTLGLGGGAKSASPSPAKPAQPAPSKSAPPAPPQNDGKVKIYGLEDGPKEIPGPK